MTDFRGTGYVGECPQCGAGIKSNEWDGWCYRCTHPRPKAQESDFNPYADALCVPDWTELDERSLDKKGAA